MRRSIGYGAYGDNFGQAPGCANEQAAMANAQAAVGAASATAADDGGAALAAANMNMANAGQALQTCQGQSSGPSFFTSLTSLTNALVPTAVAGLQVYKMVNGKQVLVPVVQPTTSSTTIILAVGVLAFLAIIVIVVSRSAQRRPATARRNRRSRSR